VSKFFDDLTEGLKEAIVVAKAHRRIEDEYEAKLDIIMEAYMDGHIGSVEYKLEIDSLEDWFHKELERIGVKSYELQSKAQTDLEEKD
jgi:hypothetical protein